MDWVIALKKCCILNNIKSDFKFFKILGTGTFSKVFLAEKFSDNKLYAIKSLKKKELYENIKDFNSVITEISILKKLKHPHILKLYECYESPNYVFLVMQYLKGGELYYHIKEKKIFNENDAQTIIKGLVSTVKYMHEQNVIHRDLKPENIMLRKKDDLMSFKIVDFGLSVCSKKDELQKTRCGSPGYVAPEVLLKQSYSYKVDMFSLGIISYTLLTGIIPFAANTFDEIIEFNKNGYINFENSEWKLISEEAKSFVKSITVKDPSDRLSAEEAEQHKWLLMNLNPTQYRIQLNVNVSKIKDKSKLTDKGIDDLIVNTEEIDPTPYDMKSQKSINVYSNYNKRLLNATLLPVDTVSMINELDEENYKVNEEFPESFQIPDEFENSEPSVCSIFSGFSSKFKYHKSEIGTVKIKTNINICKGDNALVSNNRGNSIVSKEFPCVVKNSASRKIFFQKKTQVKNKLYKNGKICSLKL